jgi:hypothetical protein
MVDPDQTPPEGLPVEEVPTSPDLAAGLRCPRCHGERYVLSIVEVNEDGTTAKALASPCDLCRGAGVVDKKTFTVFHQTREGRPPVT